MSRPDDIADLELVLRVIKASGARACVFTSEAFRVEAQFDPEETAAPLALGERPAEPRVFQRPKFKTGNEMPT